MARTSAGGGRASKAKRSTLTKPKKVPKRAKDDLRRIAERRKAAAGQSPSAVRKAKKERVLKGTRKMKLLSDVDAAIRNVEFDMKKLEKLREELAAKEK